MFHATKDHEHYQSLFGVTYNVSINDLICLAQTGRVDIHHLIYFSCPTNIAPSRYVHALVYLFLSFIRHSHQKA